VNALENRDIPSWRRWVLVRLDATLIAFELVLSVIFLSISYLEGNLYLRGVGVGLLIAWVTSAIAYAFSKKTASSRARAPAGETVE
jgi:hypothetical protein